MFMVIGSNEVNFVMHFLEFLEKKCITMLKEKIEDNNFKKLT